MSEERQRGVDLFNEVWRLLESREDDDRSAADMESREVRALALLGVADPYAGAN